MSVESGDAQARARALLVLGVAVASAIVIWLLIGRATDAGIDRLAHLDRDRTHCDSLWQAARSKADSLRIIMLPLPDTVDAQSSDPIRRCGDLGVEVKSTGGSAVQKNRDMTSPQVR